MSAARKWCDVPRFKRPKVPTGRTAFFTPREAVAMIEASSGHLKSLLYFLFGTGARLSEALYIDFRDIRLETGEAILRDTKNGKTRIAKMSDLSVAAVASMNRRDGPVFLTPDGEPYRDLDKQAGGQIKTAWQGAMRRAGLAVEATVEPWLDSRGIAREKITWAYPYSPHTCRHTWATWFYAVTMDPKRLRIEGDWSSLDLVERYAHLMTPQETADVPLVWGARHFAIEKPLIEQQRSMEA